MKAIATKNITITDPYIKRAQANLVRYLRSLDAERFLYEVYQVAGLTPLTTSGYGGWERSDAVNFRGHFIGHFMSALSLAYQGEKDEAVRQELLMKIKILTLGFAAAQKNYGLSHPDSAGYISAFREVALDEVEGLTVDPAEKENVLVPWYNLHKSLVGLLDIHDYLSEEHQELSTTALQVATNFGDYIYRRLQKLTDKKKMLQVEYGGMNDALYRLFSLTDQKEHLEAATYFDEESLFAELLANHDVLAGHHANTMIPKFIGALNRYVVLQDKLAFLNEEDKKNLPNYLKVAENFWQVTVTHHTYCTGGNSQSEHFHQPDALYYDAELRKGDCTCETCNTYNMLKLTRQLYLLTKNPKYLDYYERTYFNAILASQNPETGMMMYFQPMGAGYNKVYNRPYDEFWCCTGTGIESFAKLADSYYFIENQYLYLNSYLSNVLTLPQNNLEIRQETNRKTQVTTIKVHGIKPNTAIPLHLALRLPRWAKGYTLQVNGQKQQATAREGFIFLSAELVDGMEITIQFGAELTMQATLDNENYVSFQYGPYVLAARLGEEELNKDNPNGILVRVGTKESLLPDTLTLKKANWRDNWQQNVEAVTLPDRLMAFKIKGTEEELVFAPYYETHHERYGIHFKLVEKDSPAAQKMILAKKRIIRQQAMEYLSLTNFDENNSEYAFQLKYENSTVGAYQGQRYRLAEHGGWFSYVFSLNREVKKAYLNLKFHVADAGKQLTVVLNDTKEKTLTLASKGTAGFFTLQIPLAAADICQGQVHVKFRSLGTEAPRLFGITFVKSNES